MNIDSSGTDSDAVWRSDASARALAAQLHQDVLDMRLANPNLLPGWADHWWEE